MVLLFTDVEGSTRAWASSPGMVRSLEQHDAILRTAFAAHEGVEFKHTGDGLCATFPSVSDAVLAAIDTQRGLDAADWGDGPALRVRVAIHAGTAHRRGDDWFGLALSRCARLMGAGHGGQVLLSSAAGTLLSEAPADGVIVVDLGRVALRDFPEPEQVWQVGADALQATFPPLRTPTSTKGNLLADLSPIVGRQQQVQQIADALESSRLVTLTGPGGVGKTRLALASAREVSAGFEAGAWLIELASAQAGADVDQVVAGGLGFIARMDASVRQSILDGIGARRMLLVLDNCEHVLDDVGALVGEALRHCAALSIITTSREPLGVEGERVIPVPSLAVESDAIELFVARATAADPIFEADVELVGEICRRLDGIPLAVELAAAVARTLSLADIAQRLRDHVDVVTAGRRGRLERHATVRAAIDWSWGLLSNEEREAFARLAVFAGPFDLDAASALIGGATHDDPVDLMSALVDKSMVVTERGIAPFRVLEPLRQYGLEQLGSRGEVEDAAVGHAEHYATLVESLAARYQSPDELDAGRRLDDARENLRAAFAFAAAREDVDLAFRIVAALSDYSNQRVWTEPWGWSEVALGLPGADVHPLRHGALICAGQGAWQLGDQERALTLADEALSIAEEGTEEWRDAQRLRAYALVFLGRLEDADAASVAAIGDVSADITSREMVQLVTARMIRLLFGDSDLPATLELVERASTTSPTAHALALHCAGLAFAASDPGAALDYQRQAADLSATTGNALIHGFALVSIAAAEAGVRPASGVGAFGEMLAHYLRVGNRTHLREFARGVVVPLTQCEEWTAAATVEGATRSSALFQTTLGEPLHDALALAREVLGSGYDIAAERGATMSDDELVAFVQATGASLSSRPGP